MANDGDTDGASRHLSFNVFPVEIQLRICHYLCDHCCGEPFADLPGAGERRQALAALSRTNRTLRAIAQPLLYHRITQVHISKFLKLLRTLVEHPDLAAGVKQYLQLYLRYVGDWFFEEDEFQFALDLRHKLLMIDSYFNEEGQQDLEDEATDGDDGQATFCNQLLLALMPNLESLALVVQDDDDGMHFEGTTGYSYLWRRFDTLASSGPGFPNLHHLQFKTEDDRGFYMSNPGVRLILLEAPNLTQLVFHGTRGVGPHSSASEILISRGLPKYESLRSLEFQTSSIDDDDGAVNMIRHFITSSRALENFRFQSWRLNFAEYHDMTNMRYTLLAMLEARKETLKRLDIDMTDHSKWTYEEDELLVPPEGIVEGKSRLGRLTGLVSVKIDQEVVCKHQPPPDSFASSTCLTDNIPGSVEDILIRVFDGSRTWEDLAELGAHIVQGRFPKLRRVIVHAINRRYQTPTVKENKEFSQNVLKEASKLEEAFAHSSIDLVVKERSNVASYPGYTLAVGY